MGIDLKTLGQRLEHARKNCGYTQHQAADAVGIPRTAVVHIEAGNRSVNTVELASFADLYGVPISYFFEQERAEAPDALVALCRVLPEFSEDPHVRQEIARYVAICEEGMTLLDILGRKAARSAPAYDAPEPKTFPEAIAQGQEVAEQERRRLGLGNAPIADMRELIVRQGIWASGAKLPDEMSGLFLHHPRIGTVILVNYGHARARKRFSYAHEYAHALFDHKRVATITSRTNADQLIEKRANAFAAAFLMPRSGVEELLSTIDKGGSSRTASFVYDVATEAALETTSRTKASDQAITFKDVVALAHHFRVSYLAAAYRLIDLGFVGRQDLAALRESEPVARQLLDLFGVLEDLEGTDKEKVKKPDHELISQVVPLALEAYSREEISKARIRDLSKKLNYQALLELADVA